MLQARGERGGRRGTWPAPHKAVCCVLSLSKVILHSFLIHLFIHLFTKTACLLCARHKPRKNRRRQNRPASWSPGPYLVMESHVNHTDHGQGQPHCAQCQDGLDLAASGAIFSTRHRSPKVCGWVTLKRRSTRRGAGDAVSRQQRTIRSPVCESAPGARGFCLD